MHLKSIVTRAKPLVKRVFIDLEGFTGGGGVSGMTGILRLDGVRVFLGKTIHRKAENWTVPYAFFYKPSSDLGTNWTAEGLW